MSNYHILAMTGWYFMWLKGSWSIIYLRLNSVVNISLDVNSLKVNRTFFFFNKFLIIAGKHVRNSEMSKEISIEWVVKMAFHRWWWWLRWWVWVVEVSWQVHRISRLHLQPFCVWGVPLSSLTTRRWRPDRSEAPWSSPPLYTGQRAAPSRP